MKFPKLPSLEEILKDILEALNVAVENVVRFFEWIRDKF